MSNSMNIYKWQFVLAEMEKILTEGVREGNKYKQSVVVQQLVRLFNLIIKNKVEVVK